MKKIFGILAALALSFSMSACDFGSDDSDVVAGDDTAQIDTVPGDDTPVTPEYDWKYVKLVDDPANITEWGCQAGNPGADIDCVEVWSGGETGSLVATAKTVLEVTGQSSEACPENDKDDESKVLGAQDGQAGNGTFQGYYSLNGRGLILELDEAMIAGDWLHIVEMHNADTTTGVEHFSVFVGYMNDGAYAWGEDAVSDSATGEVWLEVDVW